MRKIGKRNYFVHDEFRKFHHIWINDVRKYETTPWDPISLEEKIMPAKRQIREGDHPKWLSKIILEMELCNIRGSLQQFNK